MPEDEVSFIQQMTASHQKVGPGGNRVNDVPAADGKQYCQNRYGLSRDGYNVGNG